MEWIINSKTTICDILSCGLKMSVTFMSNIIVIEVLISPPYASSPPCSTERPFCTDIQVRAKTAGIHQAEIKMSDLVSKCQLDQDATARRLLVRRLKRKPKAELSHYCYLTHPSSFSCLPQLSFSGLRMCGYCLQLISSFGGRESRTGLGTHNRSSVNFCLCYFSLPIPRNLSCAILGYHVFSFGSPSFHMSSYYFPCF